MRIREATAADLDLLVPMSQRLAAFGPPAWRDGSEIVDGEVRTIRAFFEAPAADDTLLVAEAAPGQLAGFVFLERHQDYFTQEIHGHVGILVVAADSEGRGVGALLLHAAEEWARSRGYRLLTLNVFSGNQHAREVYEHLGYRAETVRYTKVLEEPGRLPW